MIRQLYIADQFPDIDQNKDWLYLGPTPGRGSKDYHAQLPATIVQWKKEYQFGNIISLLEPDEIQKFYKGDYSDFLKAANFKFYNFPIKDYLVPENILGFDEFINSIIEMRKRNEKTLLHCHAGLGRTGTVAATILTKLGVPGKKAIEQIRMKRAGCLENKVQESFVLEYEQFLSN